MCFEGLIINFFFKDKLMEKELEPPYIPGEGRTISEEDIIEARKLNVSVVERICVIIIIILENSLTFHR